MMSVVWSSKGKRLQLRRYDISRARFQGAAQRRTCGEDKLGRRHVRCVGHLATRQCELGLRRLWRLPTRQTECSSLSQVSHGCDDGSARRLLCVSDTVSNPLTIHLNQNTQQRTWRRHTSESESLLLLNRVFTVKLITKRNSSKSHLTCVMHPSSKKPDAIQQRIL